MTAPPLVLGVAVVMAESLVSVNGLPLYTMDDGAMSLTVMRRWRLNYHQSCWLFVLCLG